MGGRVGGATTRRHKKKTSLPVKQVFKEGADYGPSDLSIYIISVKGRRRLRSKVRFARVGGRAAGGEKEGIRRVHGQLRQRKNRRPRAGVCLKKKRSFCVLGKGGGVVGKKRRKVAARDMPSDSK